MDIIDLYSNTPLKLISLHLNCDDYHIISDVKNTEK